MFSVYIYIVLVDFCFSLGFLRAFLNTIDKEGFYSYLGYDKCGPVTSLGANAHRLPDDIVIIYYLCFMTRKLCPVLCCEIMLWYIKSRT